MTTTDPPDTSAERAVLGAMLLNPTVIDHVRAVLDPTDHLEARHQLLHRTITQLAQAGTVPDAITVLAQLRTDGTFRPGYLDGPYLHTLIQDVPHPGNATHYAQLVADAAHRRAITAAAQRLVQAGDDPTAIAAVRAQLEQLDRPTTPAGRRIRATRASDIAMEATDWLWATADDNDPHRQHHWLPLVGLSLLGGREGIGKSTWAYRIAAQVTTGTLPGDLYGQPRSVVIAATEDDWHVTIVPRLAAADADLNRVWRVDVQEDETVEGLSLPRDITDLRHLCQEEQVALIVLDPLLGTISAALDTHKDAEVRRALAPLAQLASDIRGAVVGLIHANKSQGVDLMTRLMASRAFGAVARSVLYAGKEPGDEDQAADSAESFLFGQIKTNLGAKVPISLRYHPEGVKVGRDQARGKDIWSSRIAVDGVVSGYLEELLADRGKGGTDTAEGRTVKWLKAYLANGPVESSKIKAAAIDAGHSVRTLQRARESLKLDVVWMDGVHGTAWSLPTTPPVPAGTVGTVGTHGTDGTVGTVGKPGHTGTDDCPLCPTVPCATVPSPPARGARTDARDTATSPAGQQDELRACLLCYRPTDNPGGMCDNHEPPPEDTDHDEIEERQWYR